MEMIHLQLHHKEIMVVMVMVMMLLLQTKQLEAVEVQMP
jgi:hypothetical protein